MKIDRRTIGTTLRQLTQQGLTGTEIAAQLGVSPGAIYYWLRQRGIPCADKFSRHFDARHGRGAYWRFCVRARQGVPYAALGAEFGFTRQRAEQICRQRGLRHKGAA